MEFNKDSRNRHDTYEKLYFKPHFGPEETDATLVSFDDRNRELKKHVRTTLQNQINNNHQTRTNNFNMERKNEQVSLKTSEDKFLQDMDLMAKKKKMEQ